MGAARVLVLCAILALPANAGGEPAALDPSLSGEEIYSRVLRNQDPFFNS